MDEGFTVRVSGDEEAERRVERLALFLSDLRSFWPMVTRLFVGWMGRQFDEEGAFFGNGWSPLSPGYAAWKDEHFPGRRILQREGPLRRAATTPARHVSPTTLILSIDPYQNRGETIDPAWFQDGTDRMPARPLIFEHLPPAAAAELDVAAGEYVADLLRRF